MLEIKAAKDEVFSLQSQAGKDKEAMEEDYQKALEVIFAYGYGCCACKHNICGDLLKVPNVMPDSSVPLPPKFFENSKCPPISTAIEDTAAELHLSKAIQEQRRTLPPGTRADSNPSFFPIFCKGPCSAARTCVLF